MLNKYFIVNVSDVNIDEIFNCSVEDLSTARVSNDGLLYVVKLPLGTTIIPSCFDSYTEYTHEQILVELQGANWNQE